MAPAVRATVRELDPTLAVWGLRTMDEMLSDSLAQRRFSLWLLGLFAAVALLLAALGIYGVMSYVVTQRTREIGVRMALGARHGDVLRLVVGQGMALALCGVGLGLVAAIGLSEVLAGLLYGVGRLDPVTYLSVAGLLTAVAALACYVPHRGGLPASTRWLRFATSELNWLRPSDEMDRALTPRCAGNVEKQSPSSVTLVRAVRTAVSDSI